MKGCDVKCPACGTVNKSLFLEETEGKYECESCGYCGRIQGYGRMSAYRKAIKDMADGEKRGERLTPLTV